MREHEELVEAISAPEGLHGYHDARAIIRLFQCSRCSHLLREPMTLPCGNSLCRGCRPRLYVRENITYPLNPGRAEGFMCPFQDCGLEHSVGDCSMDVTLNKLLDLIRSEILLQRDAGHMSVLMVTEHPGGSMPEAESRSRVGHGGRLVATYSMVEQGELDYLSEASYTTSEEDLEVMESLDGAVLSCIKEHVKTELECQVCYSLMLDPLTTPCGHTFCRRCVARVLDHSNLCPACRRVIPLPPGVQAEPTNKTINRLVAGICPGLLQLRVAAAAQEDEGEGEINVPLFLCTLAYPEVPLFLRIFEPRYRLMIRRAIESGDRKFGMLTENRRGLPQGGLGQTPFMQYGTLLHIQNIEMYPDGRSLIETVGVSRFKVVETSMRDGYLVGRVQRVDDIPLSEEEAIEARETAGPEPAANDTLGRLNHMSTQGLIQLGLDFIARAQAAFEPWLADRFLSAHGPLPSDPAIFPYWFASVLPISPEEKYQLLPTTSVRERLKITARWIHKLEAARFIESFFPCPPRMISTNPNLDSALEEDHSVEPASPHPTMLAAHHVQAAPPHLPPDFVD